jgi:nicotinamide mononucleotide (NMN) deamidase PncC
LAEAAGNSVCFRGGVVVRDASVLKSLLQIDLANDGSASAETAAAMACAVQRNCGSDFGLGIAAFPTSGEAVPTAATASSIDMAGTLHVALASGDNVRTKGFPIATHPSITKTRSAKQALNLVRLSILNRDI